jgi:Ice-binding-like/Bacterial Ig-like domain
MRLRRTLSARTGNVPADYIDGFSGSDEEGKQMSKLRKSVSYSRGLTWLMALALGALAAGCGGGGGQSPILGSGGAVSAVAPAVTVVAPLPNATAVPTNTTIITAAFTKAMDPTTLTTASFTLACPAGTPLAGTGPVTYVAAGNVATLTLPAAGLPANTVCTATVTTAAKDTSGVPLAADFSWTFTTAAVADVTPPTVTGTVPANGATNVAINTKVGATFSEAMSPATITATTFTLMQGATAVAGAVTYTGVSAVFTPASELAANSTYTATITTGATDLAGNMLAASYVWSWTTAAAADTTPPTVTGTIHVNGQTNVPINTAVGATFSEAMNPLTITNANFILTATASGTAVAGVVSYSGVSALFMPLSNLAPSTNYTVTVKGGIGGVADLAGNVMVSDFTINWTTAAAADTTPPTVTATTNGNGTTGVPVNTKVGATFSEGMNPLTVTNANFTMKATVSGTAVAGTVSYSGANAVFTPASNLAPSTNYTVTINGGVGGVTDLAGNPMAANYVWSWTTAATPDTTPPTVIGTINANGATGVSISTKAGATFSEAMDPLTITTATFTLNQGTTAVAGTVSYSGVNAVFTPTSSLAPNTFYTATITSGVKDLAGNAMAANYVWSWTTGAAPDTTPPAVFSTNPADVAVGVCMNKAVNATFSESMDPLSISTATFTLAVTTGGASVTGVVTYNALTKIATFTPAANLTGAPPTSYTATIKGGASGVKDLAGNALVADKVWSFTTNASTCVTAPVLGAASTFGGFGGNATLTSDGLNTVINGDIGVNAASTKITGLTDSGGNVYTITTSNNGLVNGLVYTLTAPPGSVAGAAVTQARADALVAFNSISPASLPGGIDVSSLAQCPSCGGAGQGPGQLAGRTLPPGVYLSTVGTYGIGITVPTAGNLTLDAGGDANAVWVFQTAAGTGTLIVGVTGPATPAVPIQVLLINGAQAKNVFWYVPGGATIGTGATMVGTMLSDAAITMSTTGGGPPPNAVTTTLNGRAIAVTAGVTMTNTVINVPAP